MNVLGSQKIPKANGHYAQAIEHNGLLYLSGQLPIDPKTREVPEEIEAQTRLALNNVNRILMAAGIDRNQVLQVRIYLSDIKHWEAVNAVYADFFGQHRPVRSIIPSGKLHFGCLLEVEATAVAD